MMNPGDDAYVSLSDSQPGFLPKHPDGLPVYAHDSMLMTAKKVQREEAKRHLRLTTEDKWAAENPEKSKSLSKQWSSCVPE